MQELGLVPTTANLAELGLQNYKTAFWNLSPKN
jgi:hypothetical protein